jgi:GDPmannose 4,6-dehydratase
MSKVALITGITGQDGSYLAEQLLEKDYKVYGFYRRSSTPHFERIEHLLDKIEMIDGDVTDLGSLIRALKESEPTEIYNLAAQSFVGTSWIQPINTMNTTGLSLLNLLEAVRLSDIDTKIMQASSSEMFGKVKETPQTEKTPFYPRSPYGVAKVAAYWISVNYRESYGMFISNSIAFNHESPRRGIEFVTRKITHGVAQIALGLSDKIELGNMDSKRDWGYAPDYTHAMHLILQQNKPDDYVIATGKAHSVKEFVEMAFKAANIDSWEKYIKINPKFIRPAEVDYLVGDATKLRGIGWKPTLTFEGLVKKMVDHDMQLLNQDG